MSPIAQTVQVADRPAGQVGYGLMGLTWGPEVPEETALAAMKAAADAGATAWSSATFYDNPGSQYSNVKLIKRFFDKYPDYSDKITVILKGGVGKTLGGLPVSELDDKVKQDIETSLDILGKDRGIDVFTLARIDPDEDVEAIFKVVQKYKDQGLIKAIGASEMSAKSVDKARKIVDIACLEIEVSLWSYEAPIKEAVAYCNTHSIPILAYSPLGRGFLTGKFKKPEDIPKESFLSHIPRFQGEAFYKNLELVDKLNEIAERKGCTAGQLALGWVLSLGKVMIPIPGSTNPKRIAENTSAADITLTEEELKTINDLVASAEVAGGRYPGMAEKFLMV